MNVNAKVSIAGIRAKNLFLWNIWTWKKPLPSTHLNTLFKSFSLEKSPWLMWQTENLKGQWKLSEELLSIERINEEMINNLQKSHKLAAGEFCRASERFRILCHTRSVTAVHLGHFQLCWHLCVDLWDGETLVQWTRKPKDSNILPEPKPAWGNLVVQEEKYLPSTSQTPEGNSTQESLQPSEAGAEQPARKPF